MIIGDGKEQLERSSFLFKKSDATYKLRESRNYALLWIE
jgi:hypothetical protein